MEEEEKDLSVDTESTDVQEEQDTAVEKTYTQKDIDDMKAKWEGNFQKKLDGAISRKMKDYDDEAFKKDQLINVLKEQTKQDSLDGLLDMSEKQYGVTIPRQRSSQSDDKVLGKHDADEIIGVEDEEYIKSERNRLANLKRTTREEETFSEINNYLEEKALKEERIKEIKENGLDEDVINSDKFEDFSKKFSKETKIKEIYDLFVKISGLEAKKPFSAGSLKDVDSKKAPDEFFTLEEFQALTNEDLANDAIYEKAMKSMSHFYKK